MAWYEVINGSADSVYNKKLYSVIGSKFGLFYFNSKNRLHVFLNTDTRYSFIKQSLELDPIDAMPEMNHYFISGNRKDTDYYDTGIEFTNIRDVIGKLGDGQGIMFWFMYYNRKSLKNPYVLQEDKYLVKIIYMQRNDRFLKQKPDEDINNVILGMIQDCIGAELNWKEIKGTKYHLYSGNIKKPMLVRKKKIVYTYKAKIEDFLELDYSTRQEKIPAPDSSPELLDFKRERSDTAMVLDSKTEIINSIADGEKTALISGPPGDGKIGLASTIIQSALKSGREVALLNTTRFEPFSNIINGNSGYNINRFDVGSDYYTMRIANNDQEATALASKLWAAIVSGTGLLRNPLVILNSPADLVPLSAQGTPVFENQFWSSFFRYYNSGSNGMGIVFLKDGDQNPLGIYVNYILRASGNDLKDFDMVKS